ncbi:MAG: sulfatase [Candidatus Coatesbacteria bacterium]|nr:sulfatase [Candidatus Coatesbacteria bacterium]
MKKLVLIILIILIPISYLLYKKFRQCRNNYNLLIITLDTTRFDYLGYSNHKWIQTPYIDSLARRGIVFTNAFSVSNQTAPAHYSLFSGVTPVVHGIRTNINKPYEEFKLPTLAEILKKSGNYQTIAYFQGPFTLKDPYKILNGFLFKNQPPSYLKQMPEFKRFSVQDTLLTTSAIEAMGRNKNHNWFLWLHYWIPHAPYFADETEKSKYAEYYPSRDWWDYIRFMGIKQEEYLDKEYLIVRPPYLTIDGSDKGEIGFSDENKRNLQNLYAMQIPSMDSQLGRLFDYLKKNKLFEKTIIVIVADHGEELMDRTSRYGHGRNLYDTSLHIPLIIIDPRFKGKSRKIDNLVRIIDIFPTVLDLLKIEDPIKEAREGISLVPLINGTGAGPLSLKAIFKKENLAYRDAQWKYIWNSEGSKKHELYDIRKDPFEKKDLSMDNKELVDKLNKILIEWNKKGYSQVITDKEHLKKLKSLGYIN